MGRLVKTVPVGQNRACRSQAAPAAPSAPRPQHRRPRRRPLGRCTDGPMDRELPRIRLTGILLEDDRILLAKEALRERSRWNLPGGALEMGETVEERLRRELREETGLDMVALDDLPAFGLSEKFVRLVRDGFPGKGSYGGNSARCTGEGRAGDPTGKGGRRQGASAWTVWSAGIPHQASSPGQWSCNAARSGGSTLGKRSKVALLRSSPAIATKNELYSWIFAIKQVYLRRVLSKVAVLRFLASKVHFLHTAWEGTSAKLFYRQRTAHIAGGDARGTAGTRAGRLPPCGEPARTGFGVLTPCPKRPRWQPGSP